MAPFAVDRVWFAYGARTVLREVSMSAPPGRVLALLGPNGSGKSTLLKLMLGLLRPDQGTVRLGGRELCAIPRRELARRVAYVPQLHRESFAFSVAEVVLMGRLPHLGLLARHRSADLRAAREALELLRIEHLADRPYTQVSGGERQLALVARALAQGARALLMDEPTNGLDYGNQVRLLEQVAALARRGLSVVFSTHHPDHALAVADQVALLREGRLVGEGPPAEAITGASLSALYGVDVRTLPVQEGVKVCVPALRLQEGSDRYPRSA